MRKKSMTIPGWCIYILRFQIAVMYFYGGIAKLSPDWLNGEPMTFWLKDRLYLPYAGEFVKSNNVIFGLLYSYSGLIFDLLIVPFLIYKKTRIAAFAFAVLFHLHNYAIFDIGNFPFLAIVLTTIFFDPDWIIKIKENFLSVFRFKKKTRCSDEVQSENLNLNLRNKNPGRKNQTISIKRNVFLSCMGLFIFFQMFVPLRFLLYSGDANWSEEGHRFSWRMMLRSKEGFGIFVVKDIDKNIEFVIEPKDYLTQFQTRKLYVEPDLIIQFAHYLGKQYRNNGHKNIEVRAKIKVSLNDRIHQYIVNPDVDLLTKKRSFFSYEWVMPLSEKLR